MKLGKFLHPVINGFQNASCINTFKLIVIDNFLDISNIYKNRAFY
jgi:hypothetical protein